MVQHGKVLDPVTSDVDMPWVVNRFWLTLPLNSMVRCLASHLRCREPCLGMKRRCLVRNLFRTQSVPKKSGTRP